jgi:MFS family permease
VLSYLIGMQLVVNVAAPFFTPYMLGPLGFSYAEFMLLTAAAFLARVIVLPVIGRFGERHGIRFVLWWGALGIVPLPVLWLVSDAFAYLLVVQIVAGSAWAALELATLLSFFEGVADHERTSVLSAFNLANAVAIAIGALIGSQIFLGAEGALSAYAWLFGVSSAGRLLMLGVLRGTRPARRATGIELRTLAVRPSLGAITRPILASLNRQPRPDDDEPGSSGEAAP